MPINQYEDLFAEVFIGSTGSADLLSVLTVRQSGSADLACEFTVRYGVADLKAELLLRQINSDLFAELWVRPTYEIITFDQPHKWIMLHDVQTRMLQASAGQTEIYVEGTLPSNMAQTGYAVVAKTRARLPLFTDLHNGHDWSGRNQQFGITSPAGTDTLWLTENCINRAEVIAHINEVLATGGVYNHYMYMEAIPALTRPGDIGIRCKDGFEGETNGFIFFQTAASYGYPVPGDDALATLGIPPYAELTGTSDAYEYNSWAGNTIFLVEPLTQTYAPVTPSQVSGAYPNITFHARTINMIDIYNASMEWAPLQEGIDSSVPLSASGKAPLSEQAYTDIIYTLNDGWKLKLFNGDYDFEFVGTTITDDGSTRTARVDIGRVDVIFNVSSYATVIEPILSEADLENIATLSGSKVHVATLTGTPGTTFPQGTQQQPVNNIADAVQIASNWGTNRMEVSEDILFFPGDSISSMDFSTPMQRINFIVLPGAIVQNSAFGTGCVLIGAFTNFTFMKESILAGTTVQGIAINCLQVGDIVVSQAVGNEGLLMDESVSGGATVPGTYPSFHVGASNLSLTRHSGELTISSLTGGIVHIHSIGARIRIDDTCISGIIEISGVGTLEYDHSGPGVTVETSMLLSQETIATAVFADEIRDSVEAIRDVERGRWLIQNNQMLFYDEEIQATLVAAFNLYDAVGAPAQTGVVERRPVDFEDTGDVYAKMIVRQEASADLAAEFVVQ